MAKSPLLMLLSRHPYAEQSGRAVMLRQRIEQARLQFEPRLVVVGAPAGDARDEGLDFLPMPWPPAIALNAARLWNLPLQTWLYYSGDLRARVAELVEESGATAVYVDMLRLAPLASRLPARTSLIVDYDDLLSERYRQAAGQNYEVMGFLARRVGPLAGIARAFARPILRAEAERCAAYEQEMLRRANLVLFTSPREAAAIAQPGAHVMSAPPLIATHANTPAPGRRLIFLGNMRYGENVVMLRALAGAAVQLTLPDDAFIEVVGDHPDELPSQFDAARFRFTGRIPDLASLAGAGVFLAPVTSGSGVKLKVLDGMALGCPVVGTPKACEGLSVRANRDLLVAADPVGVLRAALQLRDRTALKAMLAQRGRAYLETNHAPAIGERVADAMMAAVTRAR
ncbi:MAG: glycosyltransferase [Hyphomonadaceae bacterium]